MNSQEQQTNSDLNNVIPLLPANVAENTPTKTDSLPADKPLVLVPFPDGTLLRYAENPCKEGTYVLVDSVGNQVAVVVNQFVADFLARGAALMLAAMKKAQAEIDINQGKRIIIPGA